LLEAGNWKPDAGYWILDAIDAQIVFSGVEALAGSA
jgi:hypothetical protein